MLTIYPPPPMIGCMTPFYFAFPTFPSVSSPLLVVYPLAVFVVFFLHRPGVNGFFFFMFLSLCDVHVGQEALVCFCFLFIFFQGAG